MKTNLGETFFLQVHFYMKKPYKNLRKNQFSNSCKNSLAAHIDPKFCILGISFDAESEFGIHFVSGSTVTTSLVLMSRTDFENIALFTYDVIKKISEEIKNDW